MARELSDPLSFLFVFAAGCDKYKLAGINGMDI